MPLMTIIGCEQFSKELADLLAKDDSIGRLAVVNGMSHLVSKELEELGVEHEMLSSESLPAGLDRDEGFNIIVTLQSKLLHNDASKLKKETYEKIKFYGKISDCILLFYGSCEGAFDNIFSDFQNPHFSLKALCNDDHDLVDTGIDCCSSALGHDTDMNDRMLEIYKSCYEMIKKDISM